MTTMTDLKDHLDSDASWMSLFTRRFSRHPERYVEIFGVLRKYELHHIIARFMMSHRHDEEDDEAYALADHPDDDDDHAEGMAKALEELGPCFIKLGNCSARGPICCRQTISRPWLVSRNPSHRYLARKSLRLSKASLAHPLPRFSNRSILPRWQPLRWLRSTGPSCGVAATRSR